MTSLCQGLYINFFVTGRISPDRRVVNRTIVVAKMDIERSAQSDSEDKEHTDRLGRNDPRLDSGAEAEVLGQDVPNSWIFQRVDIHAQQRGNVNVD